MDMPCPTCTLLTERVAELERHESELENEVEYWCRRYSEQQKRADKASERVAQLEAALKIAMMSVESDATLSLCQQALQTRQVSAVGGELTPPADTHAESGAQTPAPSTTAQDKPEPWACSECESATQEPQVPCPYCLGLSSAAIDPRFGECSGGCRKVTIQVVSPGLDGSSGSTPASQDEKAEGAQTEGDLRNRSDSPGATGVNPEPSAVSSSSKEVSLDWADINARARCEEAFSETTQTVEQKAEEYADKQWPYSPSGRKVYDIEKKRTAYDYTAGWNAALSQSPAVYQPDVEKAAFRILLEQVTYQTLHDTTLSKSLIQRIRDTLADVTRPDRNKDG